MRIGIKSGSFSLITPGHIWMLRQCKEQCDYLIVLTNSDHYIQRKKGFVPISLIGRMEILKSIKYVDEVGWFEGTYEDTWIENFKVHFLTQRFGADAQLIVFHSEEIRNNAHIPARRFADEIIFVPRIEGSTTDIIATIAKNYRKGLPE
jgi:cytidyltransferase-like protein